MERVEQGRVLFRFWIFSFLLVHTCHALGLDSMSGSASVFDSGAGLVYAATEDAVLSDKDVGAEGFSSGEPRIEQNSKRAEGLGGNWRPEKSRRGIVSVVDFGAKPGDLGDDLDAFTQATEALQPWQTLYIPPGEYRLSGKWVIKNKYRVKIESDGVIKPLPPYSDYLVEFDNDVADPMAKAIGQQVVVRGLTVDGEWRARGVKIARVWDSSFENLHIWRPYGHGINTPMLQEVSFYKPVIFMGKPRMTRVEGGDKNIVEVAQQWDQRRSYRGGEYVKTAAQEYSPNKSYVINELVRYQDSLYRSLREDNVNVVPLGSPLVWERVSAGYYQALQRAGNTNRNPEDMSVDYTTRSTNEKEHYWRPVYPDEAAWEMVGTGSNATIDNVKVWNFVSRSNAQSTVLRIDNTHYSLPPSQIEFFATQVHGITKQYIAAFNADIQMTGIKQYGGRIEPPMGVELIRVSTATGFKYIGGQVRTANLEGAKGIVFGGLGRSGSAARVFLAATSVNGEGANSIGISLMPSVRVHKVSQWNEVGLEIQMNGDISIEKADPAGMTMLMQSGVAVVPPDVEVYDVKFSKPMAFSPKVFVTPRQGVVAIPIEFCESDKSGLIRVTVRSHGFKTGDSVQISGVAGMVEANRKWDVDIIDADTLLLRDSSSVRKYKSGGMVRKLGLETRGGAEMQWSVGEITRSGFRLHLEREKKWAEKQFSGSKHQPAATDGMSVERYFDWKAEVVSP